MHWSTLLTTYFLFRFATGIPFNYEIDLVKRKQHCHLSSTFYYLRTDKYIEIKGRIKTTWKISKK